MKARLEHGSAGRHVTHRPLEALRQELDRLLDEVSSLSPFGPRWAEEALSRFVLRHAAEPRADFIAKEDAYQIDLDVPGLARDQIDIALDDGRVTVTGRFKDIAEDKGKEYYLLERRHKEFARTFSLPPGIDTDKVAADLHDGVLTIHLPKSEEARRKVRHVAIGTQG